ncbi:MAG: hypothetical protein ACRCUY_06975 [Thermoguttaceae bacterium]
MFGFGSMSSFYHDEDFENPTVPGSRAEFACYDDDELAILDADEDADGYCRVICPECGRKMRFSSGVEKIRCKDCGGKFIVN